MIARHQPNNSLRDQILPPRAQRKVAFIELHLDIPSPTQPFQLCRELLQGGSTLALDDDPSETRPKAEPISTTPPTPRPLPLYHTPEATPPTTAMSTAVAAAPAPPTTLAPAVERHVSPRQYTSIASAPPSAERAEPAPKRARSNGSPSSSGENAQQAERPGSGKTSPNRCVETSDEETHAAQLG